MKAIVAGLKQAEIIWLERLSSVDHLECNLNKVFVLQHDQCRIAMSRHHIHEACKAPRHCGCQLCQVSLIQCPIKHEDPLDFLKVFRQTSPDCLTNNRPKSFEPVFSLGA